LLKTTGACLLVVDADDDHRALVELLLRQQGVRDIEVAPSLAAAMTVLEAAPERFDAVLLGVQWPGSAALAGCRRLKDDPRFADLPVIVVAAQSDGPATRSAFEAGATDYLRKPIDRVEFAARVRAAVRFRFEIARRKQREVELAAALATLRADLDAAAALQRSLLPPAGAVVPGVLIAHAFKPGAELGGDLFNVVALPDGRALAFLLDVAGHGVAAALTAVAIQRLLVAGADGGMLCDAHGTPRLPDEVAAMLNRRFRMEGDSLSYLSFACALLDPAEGQGWVVQAGHPPLIVARGEHVATLDAGDLPIGVYDGADYHSHRLALPPGTRLVFYSDGVTEAASPTGELFGIARLCEAVRGAAGQALDALPGAVLAAMCGHRGGDAFADDVALLALEVHALTAPAGS